MYLRRFKIATRTLACFAVMVLLVLGLGIFSLAQLSSIRAKGLEIENDSLPGIALGDAIALAFSNTRYDVMKMLSARSADQLVQARDELMQRESVFAKAIEAYQPFIDSPGERELIEGVDTTFKDYARHAEQVHALITAGQEDAGRLLAWNEMAGIAKSLMAQLEGLKQLNDASQSEASTGASHTYATANRVTLFTMGSALLVTLILAWRLTVSLSGPIRQALAASEMIAAGDLRIAHIESLGSDEAALLLQSIVRMRENLRNTLSHVGQAAGQVFTATEELNILMRDNNADLRVQNSEIEMSAAAVTEMSQAVQEVTRNAVSTSEESKASARAAQEGQGELGLTVGSIKQLTEDVQQATDQAQLLAVRTLEISKVLEVIRSVSEQTNLLALNAAIEAARAGDAGRGFDVVVADEVRALAHRTSASTREIESMIEHVQQGTQNTVAALSLSREQAHRTKAQAELANAALASIANSVMIIDDRNLVIASACEEQTQVAREVDSNLVRIRDLAAQSATRADKTAHASQLLAELANGLNERLRHFQL
ncbi:methyl-accepting chemotaxis protein [Pseudomonas syringae group genomosp. 3]|uniref:methyl-accepting chemotaxis protein n=1 Tax=Pseudomonas syringae group genomosp. 3 TaxID=251701 RepID=UPI0006E6D512|nr:methyl-accepting chemotaxis protein [Pseudomonas syringae group genomosp. 3]KPY10969.1 Methyl-accepting chemotaxis protein [Pseudomonas syringae pv. philadelphi]RMM36801.1 Methyl-accepting chemotaxis protein [Pseudomonas syringae pv. berberidis]RMP72454.1 Methyl-accepting chemotaxis protein [Pseudomonas syringae pv. berberidis]